MTLNPITNDHTVAGLLMTSVLMFPNGLVNIVTLSEPTSAAHRSKSWMTSGYGFALTKLVMLSVPTSTVRWSISRMTTGWIYVSAIMFNPPRLRKSLIFPSSSPLSTKRGGPGG